MMGRALVGLGLLLILVGVVVIALERGLGTAGRGLPGDMVVRRGNFTFYFPIATSILVSLLLTGLMWLIGWLSRR
jgi:hypothetical protein